MPRNVLVLVVRLALLDLIVRVSQLARHYSISSGFGNLVVIVDSLATNYDLRTKLAEDGSSRYNTNGTTFI